jgi:DNA-binding NtrC family response regulator
MTTPSTAHILLVDNDKEFLRATMDLLYQQEYACTGITDAAQTITAMQACPYDVLITNLSMYGYQELELLRTGYPRQLWVPTIAIADAPSLHTAVEALRLSVVDYLIKPIEPSTLVRSIRLALEQQQRQHTVQKAYPELLTPCESLAQPVSAAAESSWPLQDGPVQTAGERTPSFTILLLSPMIMDEETAVRT